MQTQRQEEASLKRYRGQALGEAGTQSSGSESHKGRWAVSCSQPSLPLSPWPPYLPVSLQDQAGGLVSGKLGSGKGGEPVSAAL